MPKIVDHDARRVELAELATQALVDEGWEGVTLRGLATRSGWSIGSIRHYFTDQQALREFVAEAAGTRLREQVRARVVTPRQAETLVDAVAEVVAELLPLDAGRRREYALWVALVAWERDHPTQHSPIWDDQRELHLSCVRALAGREDERVQEWAGHLHALTDGLAAQMTHTPDRVPAAVAMAQLRGFLTEVSAALGRPPVA